MTNLEDDINSKAYKRLLRSDTWYNQFKEKYVLFIDGWFIDYDSDKDDFLKRIRGRYPKDMRFVTKVSREETTFDIAEILITKLEKITKI